LAVLSSSPVRGRLVGIRVSCNPNIWQHSNQGTIEARVISTKERHPQWLKDNQGRPRFLKSFTLKVINFIQGFLFFKSSLLWISSFHQFIKMPFWLHVAIP